jgi:MFS family permease
MTVNPSSSQRRTLALIFLTVFMDIVGFSIIIPLFPHLLDYYITAEGATGSLVRTLMAVAQWIGGDVAFQKKVLLPVLFGGLLSSLYSGLQFVFSPIWGSLSDRLGRRRILTITLAGSALSYILWIFAAHFWVVVLTRLVCGMMAGNIAVASAAAADITDEKERTKGMAVVGIAIGLGFLCGPIIGAVSAPVPPSQGMPVPVMPEAALAWNLFSWPALVSACMAGLNFLLVLLYFPETLPPERRAGADAVRPSIFDLAKVESSAVRRTSLANLIYQIAFTGMENTVVFLTFALFAYKPGDNATLFLFNGGCMIVAQGMARQLVKRLGQRRVVITGMVCALVAFALVACIPQPEGGDPAKMAAWGKGAFYLGMGLISFATGLILPSISSLASLYSSPSDQGRNLGILRSAGSLARVVGPITAALIYFKTGSHAWVYVCATLLMLPAIWVVKGLPDPEVKGA